MRTFCARKITAALALLLAGCAAASASGTAPRHSITVSQLFHEERFQAAPPQVEWSPDSSRLMYVDHAGNLVAIHAATGDKAVLIPAGKMSNFNERGLSEWDRALIARYHETRRLWTPNSQNVLLVSRGGLWLFHTHSGVGIEIASTGSGRGGNPQFSPDGKHLSYIRGNNLYTRPFPLGEPETELTRSTSKTLLNGGVDWVYQEELNVSSNYFWSPDSKHIAYLEMNEASVPRYPIEDFLSVHPSLHQQFYPQPGDPNPVVRVGVVGAGGGKTRWIKLPIDEGADYIPRFGWLDNQTLWIETLSRDQTTRTIYFADFQHDKVNPVLTLKDKKFLGTDYDLTWLPSRLLLTSWQDGYRHIYVYQFDPRNPLQTKATMARELGDGDWDVAAICAVNRSSNTVYYLSNQGNPRQQKLWAAKMDGSGLRQISEQGGWHEPVFSPNAKSYADTVSSLTTPPSVDLCREGSGCRTFWTAPKPFTEASGIKLIAPTPVEFTAADGTTRLEGLIVLPPGKTTAQSVPLIMNPYGGPDAQSVVDRWSTVRLFFDQILAQHGFAVLTVDNRGMAGRGRDFAQAAYHNFGPIQLSDQMAALHQALARYPQLDGRRIGWWGWSWGGTLTLYAMTHSDRVKAGVAVAPVTDWRDYDSIYTERYLGLPSSNRDIYERDSVIKSALNLNGHLLIAHGTGDGNVHFSNSVQFIHALVQAGIPYELAIYPGKTHDILGAAARTDLFGRILAHFERYLEPPIAGSSKQGGHAE